MNSRTDVLVIGGGATGTGIARDLALRDVDVTLVERDGLASGASGRSHGLLHSGARYAEADEDGARECLRENRILRAIGGECVRHTRGLFVQLAGDDPTYFDEKRAACEEIGIPTEVVDGNAIRAELPELNHEVERAMWVPDGVVIPSRLVAANAADARDHGAEILTHAPVTSITLEEDERGETEIARVSIGGDIDGTIEPAVVVNATGAYAGQIGEFAGVSIEMRPTRGVMISVEYDGLEPVLNRCRDPDDGDIIVPHDEEVVLGTTSVPVSDPDDYEQAEWEIEETITECAKLLPDVSDRTATRTWWGVRPLYEPDEATRGGRAISRGSVRLDHAEDGVENFVSIVGGKLTTYREMAEMTADLLCEKLGVDAQCLTAEVQLPNANDPAKLDEYVREFDAQGPTDTDLVTR
ncbi:FAD-dependent oxidoreductase [Halostagnicola sp. A-GB9-2]|uniref:FAD-dependent oxidoreductase n=1 Tax=Halostagnicola sp. A-GB9-2 TaxID=3048066 RepID=UPI0024C049DE|nr:FAD-dependent oxidoreductase [Halostagnicola sp. A-GB9-2]MDJ1433905.1 FAD-dependent oxidoreductase [Halostagnicola sp. A-GB9-2]